MIRNVVMGRLPLSTGVEAKEQLINGLRGIAQLQPPGLVDMKVGLDEGLREGGWDFAITNDWVDADAYRRYDRDEEHNRFRTMIVEVCEQVARVQFSTQEAMIS